MIAVELGVIPEKNDPTGAITSATPKGTTTAHEALSPAAFAFAIVSDAPHPTKHEIVADSFEILN